MTLTSGELRNQMKGIALAIGSFLIIVPLRSVLSEAGLKSWWVGAVIILAVLWID